MSLFKKKEKNTQPQWYRSATNMPTYNYKVYYMKPLEKILYFILGFIVGAAVGYLFYGGIGKNEYGEPTTITWILNVVISSITGLIAGFAFIPIRTKQLQEKQISKLKTQFRDFLEAFNTSLGAGKNVVDSFYAARDDLKVQYEENAYIIKELDVILSGIANNVDMDEQLSDFGRRSGVDDIESFANVFNVCHKKGGNIKDTIRSTHSIISDKMEIAQDIETVVTSSKLEQKIMIVMPVLIIGALKLMSPDFADNFVTPSGLASTTIALIMFVVAYFIGKKVLEIKL